MTIYKTIIAEDLKNPRINCISLKDCFSELFSGMTVFLLLMYFWSVVGHPFLCLTYHSSTNCVAQSTDVMFAILFLIITPKGLNPGFTYRHYGISLKIVINSTSKRNTEKS